MFGKITTLLTLTTLLSLTHAHFRITYPPDRGNSDVSQAESPCGGLNTPSSKRTQWALSGGKVEIEAGHDEALMVVSLGLGNNPTNFPITLAPVFTQIGLGEFCWSNLAVPQGTEGIKDGVNGTIQIRQKSDDSASWLYNCADITFVANPPAPSGTCKNGTGVGAEPAPSSATGTGSSTGNATVTGSTKPTTAGAAGAYIVDNLKVLTGTVISATVLLVGYFL